MLFRSRRLPPGAARKHLNTFLSDIPKSRYYDWFLRRCLQLGLYSRMCSAALLRPKMNSVDKRKGSIVIRIGDPRECDTVIPSRDGTTAIELLKPGSTMQIYDGRGNVYFTDVSERCSTSKQISLTCEESSLKEHVSTLPQGELHFWACPRDSTLEKLVSFTQLIKEKQVPLPIRPESCVAPVTTMDNEPQIISSVDPTLSGSARDVIRTAYFLQKLQFLLIWGPFGTGKTRTAAAALDAFPGTSLFVSEKNVAV